MDQSRSGTIAEASASHSVSEFVFWVKEARVRSGKWMKGRVRWGPEVGEGGLESRAWSPAEPGLCVLVLLVPSGLPPALQLLTHRNLSPEHCLCQDAISYSAIWDPVGSHICFTERLGWGSHRLWPEGLSYQSKNQKRVVLIPSSPWSLPLGLKMHLGFVFVSVPPYTLYPDDMISPSFCQSSPPCRTRGNEVMQDTCPRGCGLHGTGAVPGLHHVNKGTPGKLVPRSRNAKYLLIIQSGQLGTYLYLTEETIWIHVLCDPAFSFFFSSQTLHNLSFIVPGQTFKNYHQKDI